MDCVEEGAVGPPCEGGVEGARNGELAVSMLATFFVVVVTASAVLEGSSKTDAKSIFSRGKQTAVV